MTTIKLNLDSDIISEIHCCNTNDCYNVFNETLNAAVIDIKETLESKSDYLNTELKTQLNELIELLAKASSFLPVFIEQTPENPLSLYIQHVHLNNKFSDKINEVINNDEVSRDTINYFKNLNYNEMDDNALLMIFKYEKLVDNLDMDVFGKLFYYICNLSHISIQLCKNLTNSQSNNN